MAYEVGRDVGDSRARRDDAVPQPGAMVIAAGRLARGGRPAHSTAAWIFLVAVSVSSVRCTPLTSLDSEQCTTDADCAARGDDFVGTVCIDKTCQPAPAPPDPTWGCVGKVDEPSTDPYTTKVVVVDAVTQKPVADASAKLCAKLDPVCATPLKTLTLAADGSAQVTIASNANNYILVESPAYLPALYFIDTGGGGAVANVSLISPAVQDSLNQTLGVTADPTAGSINMGMSDCTHERAKGVHFDMDPLGKATPYYAISAALSPTATETDVSGNGGFINAKAGVVTLTATLVSTGEVVASVTTLSVAGAITFQPMRPTILP